MAHTTIDHGPSHHHPLVHRLAEGWWLVLLRGLVAIAFGVLALVWPGSALLSLVLSGASMRSRTGSCPS